MIPRQPVEASCKTDIGQVRQQNEDICAINKEHHYYLVADGMGGAAKGDLAARFFLESVEETLPVQLTPASPTLKERFYACFEDSDVELETAEEKILSSVKDQVYNCFSRANERIQEHIQKVPQHAGMGCTGELLTFYGNHYIVGHVGDSRSYLLKADSSLRQLTKDHSLVQDQIDRGNLVRHKEKGSVLKNVLTKAIGVQPNLEVDLISGVAEQSDIFLLCSDGLYNMVTDEEMEAVLRFDAPLSLKAEMLVNMANDNGGRDNISVTLVEIR